MEEFWIHAIIIFLIFGFNINEVKNTVNKEVIQAVKNSWTANLSDRNIFKRNISINR